jgi:cytochrome c556
MADSIPQTTALHAALKAAREAKSAETWSLVDAEFKRVSTTCDACHKAYRDN